MATIDRTDPSPSVADIAREEFVLMAKAFFAPVYGAWIVVSGLLK